MKITHHAKFYVFTGWLLAGIIGLIYVIANFNAILTTNGPALTFLLVFLLLFATGYGGWAVKRAWIKM